MVVEVKITSATLFKMIVHIDILIPIVDIMVVLGNGTANHYLKVPVTRSCHTIQLFIRH